MEEYSSNRLWNGRGRIALTTCGKHLSNVGPRQK
jgi:hypothetical protein